MKKYLFFILILPVILTACIQDTPLNPEADILTFSLPEEYLKVKVTPDDIKNDYIIVYPKKSASFESGKVSLTVTPGATWQYVEKIPVNDTLFYIDVTSESKQYVKRYSIISSDLPQNFNFETWVTFSKDYQYENPKEGSLVWFSSNNGTAIAWNKKDKPAGEYPVRSTLTSVTGNTAVELCTMEGPGQIGSVRFIPCLAGSLYLGDFNTLMGLVDPLKSTQFGIPFDSGKPTKLTGNYMYQEGASDYINSDGSTTAGKQDTCAIYSTIFKTSSSVQYLYGDNVSTSPNVIARAEVKPADLKRGTTWVYFEVNFDYDSYSTPFSAEELLKNEYKITIVFSSSKRGAYYEGRPGSRLLIDDVRLHYEVVE